MNVLISLSLGHYLFIGYHILNNLFFYLLITDLPCSGKLKWSFHHLSSWKTHIFPFNFSLATFLIFRDLMWTLLTFPAQGSSNDVYRSIFTSILKYHLAYLKINHYLYFSRNLLSWLAPSIDFFILVTLFSPSQHCKSILFFKISKHRTYYLFRNRDLSMCIYLVKSNKTWFSS